MLQTRYKNYQQVYTNGSMDDSKVDCAVISDNHSIMQRIPDGPLIFTIGAKAVDLALVFSRTGDTNNKFIIFSDSLPVLKSMKHTSSKNPHISKLLEKCHELLPNKKLFSVGSLVILAFQGSASKNFSYIRTNFP